MSKHTPGPWTIYRDPCGHADCYCDAVNVGVPTQPTHSPQYVAKIHHWGAPCPEQEANAHLIAAAPELLENLQRCALALFNLAPDLDFHDIKDREAQEAYEAADGLLRRFEMEIEEAPLEPLGEGRNVVVGNEEGDRVTLCQPCALADGFDPDVWMYRTNAPCWLCERDTQEEGAQK